MKKVMIMIVACLMTLAGLTSCGVDTKDPVAVAEAAAKCMKNGDFKGYLELSNLSPEEQDEYAPMVEEKMQKELDEKGGIDSYEIGEADINEDRGTARVMVKTVFGNGDEDESPIKLKQDENGDWRVNASK